VKELAATKNIYGKIPLFVTDSIVITSGGRMGVSEFGLSGLDVAAVIVYFAIILGIGMWVSKYTCIHM